MPARRVAAVTPFDRILAVAQHAKTVEVRYAMDDIREELWRSGDVQPWTNAIQLARDLGAIGPVECYALLDIVTEHAMDAVTQTDAELRGFHGQMRAIARENGLGEEEDYFLDEAPEEWLALNRRWEHRFDQLRAEMFRRVGEPGMARDILLRPDEFEARSAEGRSALFDLPEVDDPDCTL